ncbi:phosphodiesterase [Sphingobium indicum IP26]|uniref:Phosphodiesterase n=1 Tax=Sphingobium indicum F2 TaxID=1450518 RepID=A0A8E1C4G2_9SPHN|nr:MULTISPECIES: ectonucleotide pyrophosphatase/phosphodiesterase [Sphingobium]EPR09650.1 phosphodiesterase [Sphingobium indicum IP26]EQB05284.1 phosphodiesterase [Sphingobium sp. HDIP04]KER36233.1 phosphodiesterase [Sphingobium indicum F2]KER38317.1 phosphodiesterase [Sphingobium indicum F2]
MFFRRFSFLGLLLLVLGGCARSDERPAFTSALAEQREPVTILVSIDGFRPDYLKRGVTPHLSGLAAAGVEASMRPSFPTKTFPNHWAIVTGARPDRSGIVANRMEDGARPGETFAMATDDPFWWNEAEPIWVTAEKAGVRTGTLFWPGSNVAWGGTEAAEWPHRISGGTRPSDWAQFNQAISGTQRVNGVLDLLRRPAAIRPRFLTLYFDAVDMAGHAAGPDAAETTRAVAQVDGEIGLLVEGLRAMKQPANLIILSDHGMAEKSSERVIALDQMASPADYRIAESGPYASLAAQPGREAALESALLKPHPHMQCWRKGAIPTRFHYGAHRRIPPYFCLAETGWLIQPSAPARPFFGGDHGWDDRAAEMQALFIANGPAFDTGFQPPADLANVDVYPLLARLLGVPPLPGDGDPAMLAGLVKR